MPLGIKVGDRETRDIVDIWSLMPDEFNALAYFDPSAGKRDYKTLPEAESLAAARNREAHARARLVALHAQSQAQGPAAPHQACRRCSCGARPTASCREPYGRAYCRA